MSNCGSVIGGLNCEGFIRDMDTLIGPFIALELQRIYPGCVGLFTRAMGRYCSENDIHYSSRLSDEQVEDLVGVSIYWTGLLDWTGQLDCKVGSQGSSQTHCHGINTNRQKRTQQGRG